MQTNQTSPLTLQSILALPRDVAGDPSKLASRFACDDAQPNPIFAELSSLVRELEPTDALDKDGAAHPVTPSATEIECSCSPIAPPAPTHSETPLRRRRQRTTFAHHEQAILYAAFCEDSSIQQGRLAALASMLSRDFREVRSWWYNRRSDVRDNGRIRIPPAVQREMRAQRQ